MRKRPSPNTCEAKSQGNQKIWMDTSRGNDERKPHGKHSSWNRSGKEFEERLRVSSFEYRDYYRELMYAG